MRKRSLYLLLFIFIASGILISINFYTIKILSAVRAYVNGESEYSKGQKDALLYLYTYIETEDSAYKKLFDDAILIPMGDNLARKSLINGYSDDVTTRYFLMGRNHPKDIPNMIWLFQVFKSTYMQTPIRLWTDAQPLIDELYLIGAELNVKIEKRSLTQEEKLVAIKKITAISAELYKKESAFSEVLGNTARQINTYLLIANILGILVIIGNIAWFAILMIHKLSVTNRKLNVINNEVIETNKELDILVYSVSHDLRSPITSIQGLLGILKNENDIVTIKEYMGMVESTINKQDIFILEIIDFFKNKRAVVSYNDFSLQDLIQDVLANHKFTPLAVNMAITTDIALDKVYSDELRIKMIINNLVSNAIKYSDERKTERTMHIKTHTLNNHIIIEVTDNGVGIDNRNIDKIYNMFFVTSNINKGSGLGLYILKQNVEKLTGNVTVKSELNVGTKFTVSIPFAN